MQNGVRRPSSAVKICKRDWQKLFPRPGRHLGAPQFRSTIFGDPKCKKFALVKFFHGFELFIFAFRGRARGSHLPKWAFWSRHPEKKLETVKKYRGGEILTF